MVTACEFIYLNYIDVFKSNGGSWVANIKPIYELLGGVDNHLGAYPLIALFSFLGSPLFMPEPVDQCILDVLQPHFNGQGPFRYAGPLHPYCISTRACHREHRERFWASLAVIAARRPV